MMPNIAPCGSLTIAKRPPGKSCGGTISRAPARVKHRIVRGLHPVHEAKRIEDLDVIALLV